MPSNQELPLVKCSTVAEILSLFPIFDILYFVVNSNAAVQITLTEKACVKIFISFCGERMT